MAKNVKELVASFSEDDIRQILADNDILEKSGFIGDSFLRTVTENFIQENANHEYDNIGQFLIIMMQIVSLSALRIANKYFAKNAGYSIRFPVGDWSGDGHEKCEWYTITSNLPVERLREAHFRGPEVLGFDIGSICSEYEDDQLSTEVMTFIIKNGLATKIVESATNCGFPPDLQYLSTDSIIMVWLELLKFIDPEFEYSLIPAESIPAIHFYGFDAEGRHLKTPGYGVLY